MVGKETKEVYEKFKKFLGNKKVQWVIVAIIFLVILYTSTAMRLSNLPSLIDQTTGNYTLSDPDALYWLRLEGHLLQYGNLNGIDTMRYPTLNATYSQELLVYVVAGAYKVVSSLNHSITLQFVDAVYPTYASLLSLIIFFFLIYVLTKSKTAAVLASAFLAYSTAYLFRTTTGVSGHEALGIMFLFAVFLVFVLGLKNFHKNWKQTAIWGIVLGFLIACSFASWGGTVNFMLLIIPSTLLLYYLFHIEENNIKLKQKFFMFYIIWIVTSLLSTFLLYLHPHDLYQSFFTASGILVPGVLLFIIVDSAINYYKIVKKPKFKLLISAIVTFVIGVLGLELLKGQGFSLIVSIYQQLIHPLGLQRVALTVAYYQQPYLTDFISQVSTPLFWLLLLGMAMMCIEFTKGIKSIKQRIYLSLFSIAAIAGIVFSRYSSTSIFNGVNFLSQAIYFLGFAILIICLGWVYYKERHKIDESLLFAVCWMVVMLVTIRAAERTIFMVVPFMAFAGVFLIIKTASYTKSSKGHDRVYVIGALFILSLIISFLYLFGNPFTGNPGAYYITGVQAAQIGPLINDQWQNAMAWVRTSTAPSNIFLSWWDYGYIFQTIGQRTTVLDGGNQHIYWDHLMGRYVLTTPNPNTALAFMKAQNVSDFLIDPTDFGKYSAFSSIGSDSSGIDRYASPTLVSATSSQDYKSSNGTTRIYQGPTFVDQDIFYNGIFLPGPSSQNGQVSNYNSYFVGITMNYQNQNGSTSIQQPNAVFQYNGQQYTIPIRYVYSNNYINDYGTGINATFMIIPSISSSSNGQVQIDPIGAGIYLSPKVQQSLYARLYLMNDYYNQYPTLTVGIIEQNDIINQLSAHGENVGKFAYYNGQLLAPLEIWKVNYPSNILDLSQFRQPTGQYASLDNLTLTSS